MYRSRPRLSNTRIFPGISDSLGRRQVDSISLMLSSVVLVLTYSRSVISKVSHGTSFFANFTKSLAFAIRHPRRYFISSQFTLLFLVYFGTFSTANIIDTVSSTSNAKPASTVTTGVSKLLATSAVSTGLCVYKDSCFTKMFGRRNIGLAVPKASYALFTLRDIATVYGCFILPPVVSKKLANLPDGVKERFSYFVHTEAARDKTAQMMLPAAIQLVSTPIHLLALDLNNHQWRLGGMERLRNIQANLSMAIGARVVRIVPAFGIGGVVNTGTRKSLMQYIENQP